MRALRRATGFALLLTYAVIVLGAWVRATGSGLACPDWPTCYGHWVPLPGEIPQAAGYAYDQVMLEWVHRLLAGVILGPLVLLIGWLAWRARGSVTHACRLYAAALFLLLLVQAVLGGVTVLDQNSPWSVALHLGTALLLLSVLCLIFARSATGVRPPGRQRRPAERGSLAAGARRHGQRRHDHQERRRACLLDLAAVRRRAHPGSVRSGRSASTSAIACSLSASASARSRSTSRAVADPTSGRSRRWFCC